METEQAKFLRLIGEGKIIHAEEHPDGRIEQNELQLKMMSPIQLLNSFVEFQGREAAIGDQV